MGKEREMEENRKEQKSIRRKEGSGKKEEEGTTQAGTEQERSLNTSQSEPKPEHEEAIVSTEESIGNRQWQREYCVWAVGSGAKKGEETQ